MSNASTLHDIVITLREIARNARDAGSPMAEIIIQMAADGVQGLAALRGQDDAAAETDDEAVEGSKMRITHREPTLIEVFDPLTGRAWGFEIRVEHGVRVLRLDTVAPKGDMPTDEMDHAMSIARDEALERKLIDP